MERTTLKPKTIAGNTYERVYVMMNTKDGDIRIPAFYSPAFPGLAIGLRDCTNHGERADGVSLVHLESGRSPFFPPQGYTLPKLGRFLPAIHPLAPWTLPEKELMAAVDGPALWEKLSAAWNALDTPPPAPTVDLPIGYVPVPVIVKKLGEITDRATVVAGDHAVIVNERAAMMQTGKVQHPESGFTRSVSVDLVCKYLRAVPQDAIVVARVEQTNPKVPLLGYTYVVNVVGFGGKLSGCARLTPVGNLVDKAEVPGV